MLPLSVGTMERAVSLARKLSRHALRVYDLMEADEDIQGARKILRWIKQHAVETFTARECHADLKISYPKRQKLDPGLNILIERCYIRRIRPQEKRSGRPSETFEVNPLIHGG